MKVSSLAITTFASTTVIFAIASSSPSEAFRKPWTQVKLGELTNYEFRTGCLGEVCFGGGVPSKVCRHKFNDSWAFYRYDEGQHRCWARRFR